MKNLNQKLEDWNKLTKLKNQIDTTGNEIRKVELIRSFSHQARLYHQNYGELYSPITYMEKVEEDGAYTENGGTEK